MNFRRISNELKHTLWVMNTEGTEIVVNETAKFMIPPLYPFKCPQLMIQGHPYLELLKRHMSPYTDMCNQCHIHTPCLCCKSITSRWSPCYTCKDIYQEFFFFKRMVYDLYVLQKLYDKNIPDIIIKEISTYLL